MVIKIERIEIRNDKGQLLDLASSLALYLAKRRNPQFHSGEWLKSLSNEELAEIQVLSEASNRGDEDALCHLLHISLLLITAETGKEEIKFRPETSTTLATLAAMVSLERQGLIIVDGDLRYDTFSQISVTVTASGLAAGDLLLRRTVH